MSLKIIKAGLLDTVQDGGRYGYQHLGINPGGAMDRYAAGLANALLGKDLKGPVLEMHFPAPQILFTKPAIICLAGADFTPVINGEEVAVHQPLSLQAGNLLSFKGQEKGARCYLALFNELNLPSWLGSYSTNLKAAAGGFKGRGLKKDDNLPFADLPLTTTEPFVKLPWWYHAPEEDSREIAFIQGPEWSWMTTKSQTLFLNNGFTITPASDRMGYRLQGVVLEQGKMEQLVSSAVTFGTVQLLPDGQLIVLMADHQTTGGYPRIASVISAHLPRLSQMLPGEVIPFAMATTEEAEAKYRTQQKSLVDLQNTCKLKMQNWLHAHRY